MTGFAAAPAGERKDMAESEVRARLSA